MFSKLFILVEHNFTFFYNLKQCRSKKNKILLFFLKFKNLPLDLKVKSKQKMLSLEMNNKQQFVSEFVGCKSSVTQRTKCNLKGCIRRKENLKINEPVIQLEDCYVVI